MRNTTLCYIENENDEYLMLHCVKQGQNNDKWLGVGGKFEDKESPEDCMLRETLEETGLTLLSYKYRGIVTFVSDKYETEYMHLFTADKWEGDINECDEGKLVWVNKKDVINLPIWQGDKLFLDLISKDIPFFSLKLCYEGDTLVSAVLNGKSVCLG